MATSDGIQLSFSKPTFLKPECSNKKYEVCHSFLVKIFINLSIEEVWRNAVNKAKKSFVSGGFAYKAFPFALPDTIVIRVVEFPREGYKIIWLEINIPRGNHCIL